MTFYKSLRIGKKAVLIQHNHWEMVKLGTVHNFV